MKKETGKSGAADLEQAEQTGARPKSPMPKQIWRHIGTGRPAHESVIARCQ